MTVQTHPASGHTSRRITAWDMNTFLIFYKTCILAEIIRTSASTAPLLMARTKNILAQFHVHAVQ
jgi:hypothetical protein